MGRTATEAAPSDVLTLSPYQERIMSIPEGYSIALLGGKGGGKTHALIFLALRAAHQLGPRFRGLFVRFDHAGAVDFVSTCLSVFAVAFGPRGFSFNNQSGIFRFRDGGTLEVQQISDLASLNKLSGRNFNWVAVDEIQQFPSLEVPERLWASLRGPPDIPLRMIVVGNPGGPGHASLLRKFFSTPPWVPFTDEAGHTWVRCPSTYKDNPFLNADYENALVAAYSTDAGLLKSARDGDWHSCLAGAFFASCISESRNSVPPWSEIPKHRGEPWATYLTMDFGSSAPAVVYVVARSPGATGPDGKWYPRDSLVLIDELSTSVPGDPTRGLGWTVSTLSDAIKETVSRWDGVRLVGCADDSIFSRVGSDAGSISDEFARHGIRWYPAKKGSRVFGWEVMRRLLQDAGTDKPGLFIASSCTDFWRTVPFLSRDPRRPSDVDSRQADHAGDAARYGCLYQRRIAMQGDLNDFFAGVNPA